VSLLRATKSPDPEADLGRHEFAYALVPHADGWRDAGIVAEAARFNAPIRWVADDVPEAAFAALDDANLVLDAIKRAEDSDALVLRLYEAHGGRGTARVRVNAPFTSARRANLLEDDGEALEVDGDAIAIPYRPHEIVTVKVS
jgi:alpha-mannosidase